MAICILETLLVWDITDLFSTSEMRWADAKFPDEDDGDMEWWVNHVSFFKATFLEEFYWIQALLSEEWEDSLELTNLLFEKLGVKKREWEGLDLHTTHLCEEEHPYCGHQEWVKHKQVSLPPHNYN